MKQRKRRTLCALLAALLLVTAGCGRQTAQRRSGSASGQETQAPTVTDASSYIGTWTAIGSSLDGENNVSNIQIDITDEGDYQLRNVKSGRVLMEGAITVGDGTVQLSKDGRFRPPAVWGNYEAGDVIDVQAPADKAMIWTYNDSSVLLVQNPSAAQGLQTMLADAAWYTADKTWELTDKNGSLVIRQKDGKDMAHLACVNVQNSVYTFAAQLDGSESLPENIFGTPGTGLTTVTAKIERINDQIILSNGDKQLTFGQIIPGANGSTALAELAQKFWVANIGDVEYSLYLEVADNGKITANWLRTDGTDYAALVASAEIDEVEKNLAFAYVEPDSDSTEDKEFYETMSNRTIAHYAVGGGTLVLTFNEGTRMVLNEDDVNTTGQ